MDDKQRELAIRSLAIAKMAVGTVELARRLGISSPAISQWTIVPAERVIAVEAVTHVSRHHLRPDIYPQEG